MRLRLIGLTALALAAFAANSLLCRAALAQTGIDAATFSTVRLLSGALVLAMIVRWRVSPAGAHGGDWPSALALFAYAFGFSFAYVRLPAAVGALLLFGAVQATMIGWGLARGERLRPLQALGLALACGGLLILLMPGFAAPPPAGAMLMIAAGIAWGVYSLRGRGATDPLAATAGNFARTVPLALLASALLASMAHADAAGIGYAIASGALASGLGYAIWYTALPSLPAAIAATVQLCVPLLAAGGGILFLGESPTLRLVAASAAILGGVALVVLRRDPRP